MSNGRSTSGCHRLVFALALAGLALGHGASSWAADAAPAASAAASSGAKTTSAANSGSKASAGSTPAASGSPSAPSDGAAEKWALLDKYCSKCHNTQDWAGGVAFDTLTPESIPQDAETWEKAVRKLRGGLMPPAGNPRPDNPTIQSFVSWMEGNLDHAAATHTETGRVALHRLNRKEYTNAIRDLLDVEMDPAELLPRDDARDGFDNVADALQVSPSFLDQYLAAARTVAVAALGNVHARPVGTTYAAGGGEQFFPIAGAPPGTRGGIVVTHPFPADGEYVINISNMAQAIWVYNMEFENHLVVSIDRRKIYETTIGGEEDMKAIDQKQDPAVDAINKRLKNIRFRTTAGPHEIAVTFLHRSFAESEDRLQQHVPGGGQDRILRVSSFEVRGPTNASGVSETPSRQRVLVCRPANSAEENPCARKILQNLAARAYRRPANDTDVADLMKFYEAGRRDGFEAGIRQALTALLADPEFLYRAELPPQGVVAGNTYRIGDLELASRLSFFLWSSLPDEELLRAARNGDLRDNTKLAAQVRRLLADPRSQTLASNFAFQWLNMAKLGEIQPDVAQFPMLNGDVRSDFREELTLFVDSVFRENRSVLELLSGDYTYVNERLALLYGIRDVKGDRFRRVQLADSKRFGLLGKGAVLMVTSYPNRTAPVLRGAFVLERLMGTPPAAPPPNVGNIEENKEGVKPRTMKEIMAVHRSKPSCNGCHGIMDPLGFALEGFDAVGQERSKDRFASSIPVDTLGELPDGHVLKGPDDLRNALLAKPDQFVQTLVEKLLVYATGRTLEYTDMPEVRSIVRATAPDSYRFESLVMKIVTSPEFQMARTPVPGGLKTASTK
jgi:hypothetical protein